MARKPNPMLRTKRKGQLVKAIVDIITEEGINEATTRKISIKSGLTIASLHYYFGSKDEALVEAARFILEDWVRPILFDTKGDLKTKILRLFKPPKYMTSFAQILTRPYRTKDASRQIRLLDKDFTQTLRDFFSTNFNLSSKALDKYVESVKTFIVGMGYKAQIIPEELPNEVDSLIDFLNKIKEVYSNQ